MKKKIKIQKILFVNAYRIELYATDIESGRSYTFVGHGHSAVEKIMNNWNKTIEIECERLCDGIMQIN